MKRKKLLILIIILIVMLIILTVCVIGLKQQIQYNIISEDEGITDIIIDSKLKKVSNRNNFYVVKSCINKFYTSYTTIYESENDNYVMDEEAKTSIEKEQKENAEIIYNMLDSKYIEFKGITKENILTKLEKINDSIVNITNMYVSEKSNNILIYIVNGTLRERMTGEISNFEMMVEVDSINKTFTVFLQDYIDEKYKDLQLGKDIDIEVPENIEKNENNLYDFRSISDDTYSTDLLNKYKEEILYNSELAYEHLDEEYRNKRFGTLENFKIYAKNNVRRNVIMQIDKYQKTVKDGYTQYVCIDQNGNYYIFKETAVMQYSLILDTYTIDLPEFIEKYNNSAENEKVMLNIQKILEALNSGDYKYVYDKLDNTFKANYFKTQANFEEYIKKNFYTQNKITYGDYQKNGDVYIYNVQISDLNNNNSVAKSKKIVMQLKEGTDFVMSFNVE